MRDSPEKATERQEWKDMGQTFTQVWENFG